jgi:hypothetical protein
VAVMAVYEFLGVFKNYSIVWLYPLRHLGFKPVGTPKNKLFTLTWTATSSTGQTLVVTEGSFNTGP